jgi:hypothetical protein
MFTLSPILYFSIVLKRSSLSLMGVLSIAIIISPKENYPKCISKSNQVFIIYEVSCCQRKIIMKPTVFSTSKREFPDISVVFSILN